MQTYRRIYPLYAYKASVIRSPQQVCLYQATKMLTGYINNTVLKLGDHTRKTVNYLCGSKHHRDSLRRANNDADKNKANRAALNKLRVYKEEIAKPHDMRNVPQHSRDGTVPHHFGHLHQSIFPSKQSLV